MYRFLEEDTFRDLESIIRETMRTASLWDEANEEEQEADSNELHIDRPEAASFTRERRQRAKGMRSKDPASDHGMQLGPLNP